MKIRILIFVLILLFAPVAFAQTGQILGIYFSPGADCETQIIRQISQAHKIDIVVYAINNTKIVAAIINAHRKGTKIRIITDRLQAKGKHSKIPELANANIALRLNQKHKIEHNKFAIFDDNIVISGSFNWTNPASSKNSENCMLFKDDTQTFSKRFEYLWKFYEK